MKPEIFKKRHIVPAAAIDALNHVNNVVYLQWCLDAAHAYWITNTTKELRKDFVWVVLNHYITYKSPSYEGEELETQAWVEKMAGYRSKSRYKIIRPSDNKTIVEASTDWCLLDGTTNSPAKIPLEIADIFC